MYNYGEIKLQNKQDAFSAMYFFVSTSILEFCGRRNGEKICREAMRRAGRESGLAQKKKFIDAGIKTNLQTLFHSARDYVPDPRFHAKELFNEEQRQVYEIFTCPMADFWNSRGGGKVGISLCAFARVYRQCRAAVPVELSDVPARQFLPYCGLLPGGQYD